MATSHEPTTAVTAKTTAIATHHEKCGYAVGISNGGGSTNKSSGRVPANAAATTGSKRQAGKTNHNRIIVSQSALRSSTNKSYLSRILAQAGCWQHQQELHKASMGQIPGWRFHASPLGARLMKRPFAGELRPARLELRATPGPPSASPPISS